MEAKYGKKWTEAVLAELEAHGKRILQECVAERTYTHRTYNLYDSYGYGIYIGGVLVRFGYLSAIPRATEKPPGTDAGEDYGRVEIRRYLSTQHRAVGGIEMVIVAAMPYARILEEGNATSKGSKKRYKVISMAYDKLVALSSQYKGSRVRALTGGKI